MSDGAQPFETTSGPGVDARPAGARTRSETTTLACAVAVAVALGVACGVWLNSLLTSAASAGTAATSRPTPIAHAASPPAPAAEQQTDGTGETPPQADATETSNVPVEPAGSVTREEVAGATDEGRGARRAASAATRVAREASTAAKTDGRPDFAPRVEKRAASGGGRVRESPCGLYASAAALTVRGGGAAPLILGGPGEAGRVTVSTPNWSDIAVFNEGRAGGNGWLKFSVRSVSKRPGVYTVRFTTPCGSKTIPVTVTR